jgi:hypothetical protein
MKTNKFNEEIYFVTTKKAGDHRLNFSSKLIYFFILAPTCIRIVVIGCIERWSVICPWSLKVKKDQRPLF